MSEPRTNPSRTPGEVLLDIQPLPKKEGRAKPEAEQVAEEEHDRDCGRAARAAAHGMDRP